MQTLTQDDLARRIGAESARTLWDACMPPHGADDPMALTDLIGRCLQWPAMMECMLTAFDGAADEDECATVLNQVAQWEERWPGEVPLTKPAVLAWITRQRLRLMLGD